MKPLLSWSLGKSQGQWLFEQLRKLSLAGLNIGQGGRVSESGEEYVLRYLKKKVGCQTPCLFDVGANVGTWTKNALHVFEEHPVEIYAFEPSLYPFEQLKTSFQHQQNVHPFALGLSDEEGASFLFSNEPASGIASLYRRRLDHFGPSSSLDIKEQVRICTLDDFCKKQGIDRIDLLKLDVEGHELNVLNGAKTLLKEKAIHHIQFEFGGCNIDSRTYFQDFYYFLNDHYRIFRVLKNGLCPIPKYREIDECFVTTNYFAELRDP